MSKYETRCVICDSSDWENVDRFLVKPQHAIICKKCGFVTYGNLASESDMKKYYLTEYRTAPSSANIFSGQRKINYHKAFLNDTFNEWKKTKKEEDLVFSDIGAAIGLLLVLYKRYFPKCTVKGTEWTTSYRRCALNEFGIKLDEEFDDTIKYDLISSFKVAEHQQDADKKLIKYKECLKPDGLIYISVPTWFEELSNFGVGGFDLNYYYHKDHINVWSKPLFETLLKKVGLEVVKENHTYYGDTYLCKRNDELMKGPFEYCGYEKNLDNLKRVKGAFDAISNQDFETALKLWPNFPMAWLGKYELSRKKLHDKGQLPIIQSEVLDPMLKANPESFEAHVLIADLYMRYDNYPEAIKMLEKSLDLRPGQPKPLIMMSHCFRQLSTSVDDPKVANEHLKTARNIMRHCIEVSEETKTECLNWILNDASKIKLDEELV